MKIRHMVLEDIPQVAAIEQAAFSQPWSPRAFRDTLSREDTLYLVAEKEGRIVGYAGLWQSLDEGEIPNIAVHEDFRCQGVGGSLLEGLFTEGAKRGIEAFTLEVRIGNKKAISLYKKNGFQSVGVRPGFYSFPTEDAVIMWKR